MPEGARKPVVGFFACHGSFGGTEVALHLLMPHVARRGYPMVLFHPEGSPPEWIAEMSAISRTVCYSGGDPAPETAPGRVAPAPSPAARIRKNSPGRNVLRAFVPPSLRRLIGVMRDSRRLSREIRRERVDSLHFSDLSSNPEMVFAAWLAGVPRRTGTLACLPPSDPARNGWAQRLLDTLCLLCVQEIIVVSKKGAELWHRRTRVPVSRMRLIYNGVPVTSESAVGATWEQVRRELGIPPEARIVGVSAAFHPIKGHLYLARAFPDVLRAVPEAWLMFAGDGLTRPQVEEELRRSGVAHRVTFLGHRSDVMRFVQAYDVIALPSVTESFPYSLLEGMACGKPAVASAVGGIPEMVEEGVTGCLVPPRRPEALARALSALLADPARMRRMGDSARRRVERDFNFDQMIESTLRVVLDKETACRSK